METKIQVTKLTHEEIVNILATAFYGNNEMEVSYPDSMDDMASYIKTYWKETRTETMTWEDKLAEILERGGTLTVIDYEDYDNDNGYNGEEPNKDKGIHPLTLKKLLDACSTTEGYKYAKTLLVDEDGDLYDAWNIIQIAMFGEVVYG